MGGKVFKKEAGTGRLTKIWNKTEFSKPVQERNYQEIWGKKTFGRRNPQKRGGTLTTKMKNRRRDQRKKRKNPKTTS